MTNSKVNRPIFKHAFYAGTRTHHSGYKIIYRQTDRRRQTFIDKSDQSVDICFKSGSNNTVPRFSGDSELTIFARCNDNL